MAQVKILWYFKDDSVSIAIVNPKQFKILNDKYNFLETKINSIEKIKNDKLNQYIQETIRQYHVLKNFNFYAMNNYSTISDFVFDVIVGQLDVVEKHLIKPLLKKVIKKSC